MISQGYNINFLCPVIQLFFAVLRPTKRINIMDKTKNLKIVTKYKKELKK